MRSSIARGLVDRASSARCSFALTDVAVPARVASIPSTSSATSSAVVTQVHGSSLSNRWHPADEADVTGPGTTPRGRPSSTAWWAVFSEPERQPASTTTVARHMAAMSRLRCRNRHFVGEKPGGISVITAPVAMMRCKSASCPLGYRRSMPPASTAIVSPSSASAARWAIPSIP